MKSLLSVQSSNLFKAFVLPFESIPWASPGGSVWHLEGGLLFQFSMSFVCLLGSDLGMTASDKPKC